MFKAVLVASVLAVLALQYADACYIVLGIPPRPDQIQALHNCVVAHGVNNDQSDADTYANAVLSCLNGDKDNQECCRKEGVSGSCLRLCNGTSPTLTAQEYDKLAECPREAFKCLKYNLYDEVKAISH